MNKDTNCRFIGKSTEISQKGSQKEYQTVNRENLYFLFNLELAMDCCCNMKACQLGTFESIFYIMKDSMSAPHVLNKEDVPENFTGKLKGNHSIS